uniref:Helicase n=1 Tax=Tanacetum cinerariifolium TaxID=118510 RepID=A0A6L2KD08_TANCI|nr:helicase [Tanacetum cinerariifolium]
MIELYGATSVRKTYVKGGGFVRYPFQLAELGSIQLMENKYLIDVVGYVTNGWDFPSCGGEKCKKGVVCKEGSFWCQACDRAVEYPMLRFRLELDVSDKTTSTVVVMFDEPATELAKCSAYSLAATDEDVGLAYADDVGIVLEEVVEEDARSSNVNTSPEINIKLSKRLAAKPTISTPSKPKEERGKKTRRRKLHVAWMINRKMAKTGKPPLLNNTNAGGKQKAMASTSRHPVNTAEFSRSCIKFQYQRGKTRTLLQNFSSHNNMSLQLLKMLFVSERPRTCASARLPKRATLTFAGVPVSYHNLGPPSYECRSCNAQMWYEERTNKGNRAINPTFSLCCQEVSEIAALITNDFGDGLPSRDIVVDSKDRGPKRIPELHPSYMALQYPLLFSYGEDGFYEKIPYDTNKGTRKTNPGYVSMKQYYAYVIQQQNDQGNTLLRGGRLFQQYLVDAYTAVEEQRLQWTRNNQDTLQVDLYHNLNDAFTRGDTNAEGLGKRIVLPRIFTGGPRYMMQNYQDAMALCRAYENPDLIITFTSNPKWPKISEMLAFIPVVYAIEFQKYGLPHAYILLWIEEEWKCKTPNQVDGIISAELPSPTTDPEGYKVVTEFILQGPCGKGIACTVKGKCSKKYPKPFYSETNLDEDGYPFYPRRDSNVQAVKDLEKAKKMQKENLLFKPSIRDRYYLRMLLNVTRGPRDFKDLMTVNKQLYPTFKAACFAYGLLTDDKEWAHAISEAALCALAPHLRDLFVTMLLFCDVSRPLKLWEQT